MKKNVIYLFIYCFAVATICFSACQEEVDLHKKGDDENEDIISSHIESEIIKEKIFDYLNTNDFYGIRNMFCEIVQSTEELDEQIQKVLEFFDGEIISYNKFSSTTNRSRSIRNGVVTELDIFTELREIKTNMGKTYEIWFSAYLINLGYASTIGLSELHIRDDTGEERKIGDYYLVNNEWR